MTKTKLEKFKDLLFSLFNWLTNPFRVNSNKSTEFMEIIKPEPFSDEKLHSSGEPIELIVLLYNTYKTYEDPYNYRNNYRNLDKKSEFLTLEEAMVFPDFVSRLKTFSQGKMAAPPSLPYRTEIDSGVLEKYVERNRKLIAEVNQLKDD